MSTKLSEEAKQFIEAIETWIAACEQEVRVAKGESYESWKKEQYTKLLALPKSNNVKKI